MWSDETKCSYLATMTSNMFGVEKVNPLTSTTSTYKHDGGSIMLRGCFAAGGSGALRRVNRIMNQFIPKIIS